jgi:hypothetical protein
VDVVPGNVPVQKFLFSVCSAELWIRFIESGSGSDPAFQVNPYPDTDPIRIQGFDDQKVNKKILLKLIASYTRSLKPSKENIQHGLISAQ